MALLLLDLSEAMAKAKGEVRVLRSVLLQVGTGLSGVGESLIKALGEQPYAESGTPFWFDAIRIGEAARKLSQMFHEIGDGANELAALGIKGRVIIRLLGHCYPRVGQAMLDSAKCALRPEQSDEAASYCEAVIADFARLVEEYQDSDERPIDEDEIALHQLLEAIDLYTEVKGESEDEIQTLRSRCSNVLEHKEAR